MMRTAMFGGLVNGIFKATTQIKNLVWKNQLQLKDVAEDLGVSLTAVSLFLDGKISSKRMESYFSKLLKEMEVTDEESRDRS